mmetsp:Transcript_35754/g.64284  ORF Transcript_35754/g.64284 Transcript_35754/m.64284 type:complete len:135 (+) Transcript_35754:68-472(+)
MFARMSLLLLPLLTLASGINVHLHSNASIPVTQKVSIDEADVYSQDVGTDGLNTCSSFAKSQVDDVSKPVITVCGTQTKVTVYLRNRCEGYHEYTLEVGACDATAPSETCKTASPATDSWMAHAQSYMITQCAV